MMRLLFILCLMVLAAVGLGLQPSRLAITLQTVLEKKRMAVGGDVSTSQVFSLSRDIWTVFALPYSTNQVRIITNGIVPTEIQPKLEELRYALHYRIMDDSLEKPLAEGVYHQRSRFSLFSFGQEDESGTAVFPADSTTTLADGRIMLFTLPPKLDTALGATGNRSLQLRMDENGSAQGVMVRVYAREQAQSMYGDSTWKRFYFTKKEQLARSNVYPQDLLEEQEIAQLLKKQWTPLGPTGVPGKDYQAERLYLRKEPGRPLNPRESIVPDYQAGPDRAFTQAIPEEGSELQFLLLPLEQHSQGWGKASIHWFGRGVGEEQRWDVDLSDGPVSFHHAFSGGLVEVNADHPVKVKIYNQQEDGMEISPEDSLAMMHLIPAGAGLHYTIRHLNHRETPVRLTVRMVMGGQAWGQSSITCRLLDKEGRIRSQYPLHFPVEASRYDLLKGDEGEQPVSEPVFQYLRLPEEIAALEITALQPTLFSLANRPPELPMDFRVPEDYYPSFTEKRRLGPWFLLQPDTAYSPDFTAVPVHIQYRPPQRRDEIFAGDYLWEPFRPEGLWRGSYLLTPRDSTLPIREAALASTYHELVTGRSHRLAFEAVAGMQSIRPQLIFLGDDDSPATIQLHIDKAAYYTKKISGSRGLLGLPPLLPGKHIVRGDAPSNTRLYINYLTEGVAPHVKRFAYRLGSDGLKIRYRKEMDEEVLGFWFYAPAKSPERVQLVVSLANGNFSDGLTKTFTQVGRRYDIRTGDRPYLPVLQSDSKYTDNGQQFFFPTGADLVPGEYIVSIHLEQGHEGLLLVYRITPGVEEWLQFFREEG